MARTGPLLRVGSSWTPAARDLARAARSLAVQSRREVTGALAGGYRSAFRGGGIEFEESRPYTAGDDVRAIDWNAYARSGVAHVKHYREERDQTLLLLVDVSASMGFGSVGPSKAALAVRSAALLASAAAAAGDRVGLWTFDAALREELPPARGEVQRFALLRTLVAAGQASGGRTALGPVLAALQERIARRAIVFLLSDLRDDTLFSDDPTGRRTRAALAALARRHDLVAGCVRDPRETSLPAVGTLRVANPEAPAERWLLRTGSRRTRERYELAARIDERRLERRLRADGVDYVALDTAADPLRTLGRFFLRRAATRTAVRGAWR